MPSSSSLKPEAEPSTDQPSEPRPPTKSLSLDGFLSHLHRCLETRTGADVVLLFLCYASRLGGSVLEALSRPILRLSARRFVAAAFKLPPAATVVLSATAPQPQPAVVALRLGRRLRALSALISETRTVGRLWGLLGLYLAVKRRRAQKSCAGDADGDAEGAFDAALNHAQMASLIIFQAAENVAFLSSKAILPYRPATQARLTLLSVRAWGLYVGMELIRLLVDRSRRPLTARQEEAAAGWRKDFWRNMAWAPLTVHWGSPAGLLPDLAVSLLAAYPATGAMVDLWRDTA
ncbi:peroxin 11C [Ophiocordyceps camponoti-floridani]|uniref:Peroxin 11C n=1 Tax=Ophiocordyceps camponoti-floridani TaxID=2030778 RepID=A0A8H4QDV0_9HYPO|nr:peroxin 11C [Ophiocordyceps camponoti-floridani]